MTPIPGSDNELSEWNKTLLQWIVLGRLIGSRVTAISPNGVCKFIIKRKV